MNFFKKLFKKDEINLQDVFNALDNFDNDIKSLREFSEIAFRYFGNNWKFNLEMYISSLPDAEKNKYLSEFKNVMEYEKALSIWTSALQIVKGVKPVSAELLKSMPEYKTTGASAMDLVAAIDKDIIIPAGEIKMIPTGIAIELPVGYVALIYARSGLASKKGLAPANKVGVVDADYRGEVMVALHNHGTVAQTIEAGERIAQMVIAPFITANFIESETLEDTVRGAGGFGSTGSK